MGSWTFLFADNPNELNTSFFRCAIPAKYLRLAGHHVNLTYWNQVDYRALDDTVLLERILFPDVIEKLRLAGVKRLVGTFDDAYHLMPDSCGNSKSFWTQARVDDFRKGIAMCDTVGVPSHILAKDYARFGRLEFLGNFPDDTLWPVPDEKVKPDVVTIGWGGSLGHLDSWKKHPLLIAMRELYSKYGDKIRFVICGKVNNYIVESGVPCNFVPGWIPFTDWPNMVRTFDIGVAPLSGAYDMRRSNLKIVEYGLAGIPFVCTDAGMYPVSNPDPNVLCRGAADWFGKISNLVEDHDLRVAVGKSNRAWAEGFLMSKNTGVYESVLSN